MIVLLGLIATLSAFSVLHLGSRTTVCIYSRKDATANVKSILTGISILGSQTGDGNVRFPVWSPQRAIMLSRAAWSLFKIAHFGKSVRNPNLCARCDLTTFVPSGMGSVKILIYLLLLLPLTRPRDCLKHAEDIQRHRRLWVGLWVGTT